MSPRFGLITGCGKGIGLSITKKLLIENEDIKVLGISRTINENIEEIQKKVQNSFIFYERYINPNLGDI